MADNKPTTERGVGTAIVGAALEVGSAGSQVLAKASAGAGSPREVDRPPLAS